MENSSILPVILLLLILETGGFVLNGNAESLDCLESDREALVDFKNGLKDHQNLLSSWQGINCCQWQGIVCDNTTGAVISIDLQNPSDSSGLGGEIRPSLTNLKSLKHLDLSYNGFNGIPIPTFLQYLEKLEYLNLRSAEFGGIIPPHLGNISTLKFLDVSSFLLSTKTLEWLRKLSSLEHLAMDGVDLSMIGKDWVEELNMLPHLTKLHLSNCKMQDSGWFHAPVNFSSLAVIELDYNNFGSKFPSWLVNISSLVYVDLSSSMVQGSIPLGFKKMQNLRQLHLANNNLSATTIQLFKGSWRRLQVLNLPRNGIYGELPDDSIGNMTSLTFLDLFDNNIQGKFPSSIAKLCGLQHLDLARNNLTGNLPEILGRGENCHTQRPFPNLEYLSLYKNRLGGALPNWLGVVETLLLLSLDNNMFSGSIPNFEALRVLKTLSLKGNELNGSLPESIGQLSEVSYLDVSFNRLTGVVSESHFSKLTKLQVLILSSNSLAFSVSPDWIPPFQIVILDVGSCNLGPSFPAWIKSQTDLVYLDFSNATISGFIPDWFWEISSSIREVNVSSNQLQGQLPKLLNVIDKAYVDLSFNLFEGHIPLPISNFGMLVLSYNKFSGSIPENIGDFMTSATFLSLASNQLTGEIPASIGKMSAVVAIDLSGNNLAGSIPETIGNCNHLEVLDLQNNNLSGSIPSSLGLLTHLQVLHLRNNSISGELPSSLRNLTALETMDLGNNRLTGKIAEWIGGAFPLLRILILRSNTFSGEIPSQVLNPSSLQVLDLAENELSGKIPISIFNFQAMKEKQTIKKNLLYGTTGGIFYYEEKIVVNIKGELRIYSKTLSLLTCIDLSGNNLRGEMPEEITKLKGLVVLNLSRNHFSGRISQNISKLSELSSLDLSGNMLSGPIPSTLSSLSFLGYLNLSNNNLSGRIPYSGHMTTFDVASFLGNPGLCGAPLVAECVDENSTSEKTYKNGGEDSNVDNGFHLAVGLGFAAGLLVPCFILTINIRWSQMYFSFVDKVSERSLYLGNKLVLSFKYFRNCCHW